jgi:flagellar basal-body rod protein FlgB
MLEQVANFAESRHTVLAGNLANIDTPGYHTRDLSPQKFQARLIEAITARNKGDQAASMGPTGMGPGGISPGAGASFANSFDPVAHVGTAIDGMLYHDDNNRGLEQEVAAMTDNETQHSMALALLASQLKLIEAAVTEKA